MKEKKEKNVHKHTTHTRSSRRPHGTSTNLAMKLTRLLFLATTASVSCSAPFGGFEVSLPASAPKPLVGRVLVYISRHNDSAPITQGDDGPSTAQIFGVDTPAGGLVPGGSVRIKGDDILGFPRPSLSALPTAASSAGFSATRSSGCPRRFPS